MSRIIKSHHVLYTLPHLTEVSNKDYYKDVIQKCNDIMINEAEQKALNIINSSKIEAAKIISEAEIKKKEILDSAKKESEKIREEGYIDGFNKGLMDGEKKAQEIIEEGYKFLEKAQKKYEGMIKKSEEDIVKLAITISEKIINQQITIDQNTMFSIIKGGLNNISSKKDLVVFLSPHDYYYILENKEKLLSDISETIDINFVLSPTKSKGYLYIESPSGQLDLSVKSQLENVKNRLLKVVELNNGK